MDIKTLLKSSVAAGALLALAAPMQTADAGGISNGNSKLDLKVGGRVVRGMAYADDSKNKTVFHTTGRSSDTEIYFSATGNLTESITVNALHRFDVNESGDSYHFGNEATGTKAQTAKTDDGVKYSKISFAHKSLGTVTMGHWSEAGDGANNLKFGGQIVASPGLLYGNITHRTAAGPTTAKVGDHLKNLDGGSVNLIRYDTPSFAGFSLSASTGGNSQSSTALRYSGKFAGVSIKAAYAYNRTTAKTVRTAATPAVAAIAVGDVLGIGQPLAAAGDVAPAVAAVDATYARDIKNYGGSMALMHSSGLHLNFAQANQRGSNLGRKPKYLRIGGGYEAKLNSMGKTNFYGTWFKGNDITTHGAKATQMNVGVHQGLDPIGGTVGLVYSRAGLKDRTENKYKDVDIIYLETVVNF